MLVQTLTELNSVITNVKNSHVIVVDLETNGLSPYLGDRLIGLALYLPEMDKGYYIPFRHGEGFNFDLSYLSLFRDPLSDPNKEYYGWNVKFDQHFLTVDGFPILQRRAIYRDVLIALQTLDENRYDKYDTRNLNYKLKDNGRLYLGDEEGEAEDELHEELKKRGIKGKGEMWKLPASMVFDYAIQDVVLTWKLLQYFLPYLEKWKQVDYFHKRAELNSTILARMEYNGVPVDRDKINEHIELAKVDANEALLSLKSKFGQSFNPNSPTQVKDALGTANSKRVTLERNGTEAATDIIHYKYLQKAGGTFYTPYLKYSAMDGRIHPTLNAARTSSRRLSSSDPNLQQVPQYSSKYRVKAVFVALEGYDLIELDYSQQELRLACHFSGQENMTAEYLKDDADVHSLTTALLFDIPYEVAKKDKEKRKIGKITNFGFSYGMGILKAAIYIASSLGKLLVVDKKFHEDYAKYLPKIDAVTGKMATSKTKNKREVTWDELVARLTYMYAGTRAVDKAEDDDNSISILTTTNILFNWRELYGKFNASLKTYASLAASFRDVDGNPDPEGFNYIRLEDDCVRHYIIGQRPFTAWNFLIQGTGASVMADALLRIDREFPMSQDEVIPQLTVHDSVILQVKRNANQAANILKVKALMEDFNYYPKLTVDVKIGQNWGEVEDWKQSA